MSAPDQLRDQVTQAVARVRCRLQGHDWRCSWEMTHVVTGAGNRHLKCRRCQVTRRESIPARGEAR